MINDEYVCDDKVENIISNNKEYQKDVNNIDNGHKDDSYCDANNKENTNDKDYQYEIVKDNTNQNEYDIESGNNDNDNE